MKSSATHLAPLASLWLFTHILNAVNAICGESQFQVSQPSLTFFRTLLKPCIHDEVLAPTRDQRLRYADWLYVWAKDRTSLPARMAGLVDDFHVCFLPTLFSSPALILPSSSSRPWAI